MTVADLLSRAADGEPGRPFVTFYDLATGERVELSFATTINWVAKTANMLQDTLGSDDATRVDLLLPVHWETVVWILATWAAGAQVSLVADGGRILVVDPQTLDRAAELTDVDDVVALSLRPLGGRFTTPLPAGVLDYNAEVLGNGDRFTAYYPPSADSPAVVGPAGVRTFGDLTRDAPGRYDPRARILVAGDRDVAPLLDDLPSALASRASFVVVRSRDLAADAGEIARIAETENVTVR